jgi:hypothetical protein
MFQKSHLFMLRFIYFFYLLGLGEVVPEPPVDYSLGISLLIRIGHILCHWMPVEVGANPIAMPCYCVLRCSMALSREYLAMALQVCLGPVFEANCML